MPLVLLSRSQGVSLLFLVFRDPRRSPARLRLASPKEESEITQLVEHCGRMHFIYTVNRTYDLNRYHFKALSILDWALIRPAGLR
jgi:hypothetical protein